MTNEEFLAHLYNNLDPSDAWHSSHQSAYEHARKLAAVAEAARKIAESDRYVGECEECGSAYDLLAEDVAALITAYRNLEGGEK